MKKIPVRKVNGLVFGYESEDLEKVQKAFSVFFPKKEIKKEVVDGSFGTKIRILRAELKERKSRELTKKILSSLKKSEKEAILEKINLHVDEEGKFYLRFDKQVAYEKGQFKITSDEDSNIQVVFSMEAFPANYENYVKSAEKMLQA